MTSEAKIEQATIELLTDLGFIHKTGMTYRKTTIRLAVKKELRRKVSILKLNAMLDEIMEQAEGQFKEWRA